MERMNDDLPFDIPFEHQMLFIIRDYDRKVEENMEQRMNKALSGYSYI